MFCGDTEQHYYSELEPIQDWHTLIRHLNDRYNGHARQQAIADEIRNLTITDYSSEPYEGLALQKLSRRIERLVPQAPHGRNTDLDKRDAMYYAIRSRSCPDSAIATISSENKTYKQFLDELATAEQNYRTSLALRSRTPHFSTNTHSPASRTWPSSTRTRPPSTSPPSSPAASVWFVSQGKYGRDPKAKRIRKIRDRTDRKCHNCGSTSHLCNECTKPRDELRILENCIKDLLHSQSPSSYTQVLHRLLHDQATHINFLSGELSATFADSDPDSDYSEDWNGISPTEDSPAPLDVFYVPNEEVHPTQEPSLSNALAKDPPSSAFFL